MIKSYMINGKNKGTSGKSNNRCVTIPIKNGREMKLFLFVAICKMIKHNMVNKMVCEIPLPEPRFKNNIDLSIISGNNEPIIRASLLNSNLFLINGSSKTMSGTAM